MSESSFSSAWNLSSEIIMQIATLLRSASSNYRNGNHQESFWDAEEIATIISAYLIKEEEDNLNEKAEKISKLHAYSQRIQYSLENSNSLQLRKKLANIKLFHAEMIKQYRRQVNFFLAKYNLGLAKKEDATRMF